MKMKPIYFGVIALIIVIAACSSPTVEQQQRLDSNDARQAKLVFDTNTVIGNLLEVAPRTAELLEKSWNDTLTPVEAQELSVILVSGPASVREIQETVMSNMNEWWALQKEKNKIRADAGGGWWEEVLGLVVGGGAGLLAGMGIPTSGPLAPLLYRLGPMLARFGWRDETKREDQRRKASLT